MGSANEFERCWGEQGPTGRQEVSFQIPLNRNSRYTAVVCRTRPRVLLSLSHTGFLRAGRLLDTVVTRL